MVEQQPPEPSGNQQLEVLAQLMRREFGNAYAGTDTALDAVIDQTGGVLIPDEELLPRLQRLLPMFMAATITLADEVVRLRGIVTELETNTARRGPEEGSH